VLLLQL